VAKTYQFDRDDLIRVLSPVARFVGKSLKATAYVRLFDDDGVLAAEATNGRASARMSLESQSGDKIDVCVHPKFLDAIKSMRGGDLELEITQSQVVVSGAAKSKFTLPVNPDPLPDTGLSDLPDGDDVAVDSLLPIIEQAAKFASDDAKRPAIHGVHLMQAQTDDGPRIAVASTDSYRFFYRITDIESFPGVDEDKGITLSLELAKDIKGLLSGVVKMSVGSKIAIQDGGFKYWGHITAEPFPNVEQILKMADPEKKIFFGRAEADRELERASVLAETGATLKLLVRDGELICQVAGSMGSSEVAWDADTGDFRNDYALNFSYLRNGIGAIETDGVFLGVSESKMKPLLIHGEDEKTFYVLTGLMPDRAEKPATKTKSKAKAKEDEEPEPVAVVAGSEEDEDEGEDVDF
jgi:DNA polymerase III sliding clamp (beta) subunit (PCNA family)